jgi:ribosomal protein S18 acetylase RimI-like enzyme
MNKMDLYIEVRHQDKGYCNICKNTTEYIINSLHVRKSYQRQNIGTALIHKAEDTIKKLGGKYAYLYVRNIDRWQHEWYKRIGYLDINSKCDEGFVKMRKTLIKK